MEICLDDVITSLDFEDELYYYIPSGELAYIEDGYIHFYDSNIVEDIDELNDDYIKLPNRDYVDSYKIMESFIEKKVSGEAKDWFTNAIKGRGAFRMFRSCLERFKLENEWYKFRDDELREVAITWCLENNLSYYDRDYFDEEEIEDNVVKETTDDIRLVEINDHNKHFILDLVIEFRKYLSLLNGYDEEIDEISAKEEIDYYLAKAYPIYAASVNGLMVGYEVLKVEDNVVWLESLYVKEGYRNRGIGKMLFDKAEEHSSDTLYINVHPNNELMLNFLKELKYDVLNLIEVRKAYVDEKHNEEYLIGNHSFKYKGRK